MAAGAAVAVVRVAGARPVSRRLMPRDGPRLPPIRREARRRRRRRDRADAVPRAFPPQPEPQDVAVDPGHPAR